MKLWPFSKKSSNMPSDGKLELPPGVMLASPDEPEPSFQATAPQPGRYDAMHADEHPSAEAAPIAPVPDAKQDLQQFFEQNQLAFVSQAAPMEPAPQLEAPQTKGEIYQAINESLTGMATDSPQPAASDFDFLNSPIPGPQAFQPESAEAAPQVGGFDWSCLTEGFPEVAVNDAPAQPAALQPAEDPDAFLYTPGTPPPPALKQGTSTPYGDPTLDQALLAPPPLADQAETASFELAPQASVHEVFTYEPPSAAISPEPQPDMAFCDLSQDLLGDLQATDLGLPADASDLESFFSIHDSAPLEKPACHVEAKASEGPNPLAALLQEAAAMEPEALLPAVEYADEPAESDFYAPLETADNVLSETGLFSVTSFDAMEGFGDFAVSNDLFQGESESLEPQLESYSYYVEESYPAAEPLADVTSQYAPGDAFEEAAYPSLDGAGAFESALEESFDSLPESCPEEGNYGDYEEEADEESDLSSYDLGHYDDPDEPAPVFSLSEEPVAANPEMDRSTHLAAMADFLAMEANLPQAFGEAEQEAEQPAFEPELIEEPVAPAAEAPVEKPAHEGQAFALPEARPAVQKAEPAKPEAKKPQPEPFSGKPLPRPKQYNDSIADALETFGEEMLMRDSHFMRNSINNLVDSYFSQQEPESA